MSYLGNGKWLIVFLLKVISLSRYIPINFIFEIIHV